MSSRRKQENKSDVGSVDHVISAPDASNAPVEKCGSCCKSVLDSDSGVFCEICETWYHAKCQAVQDGLYKLLNQYKNDVHWFCQSCQGAADKIFSVMLHLQKRIDKLESAQTNMHKDLQSELRKSILTLETEIVKNRDKIGQLEVVLANSKTETSTLIDGRIQELLDKRFDKSCIDGQGKLSFSAVVAKEVEHKFAAVEHVTVQLKEDRDIENRANNLIVYRVPESDSSVYQTRISEDREFFDELCNDVMSVTLSDDDVINMYRLGKRPADAGQRSANPRPLLVAMKDGQLKRRIMANAANLREASDRFSAVGLSNDLTPKQRADNKKLLDDAREKLKADHKDPKNYRLLIVTRDNQRTVISRQIHQT